MYCIIFNMRYIVTMKKPNTPKSFRFSEEEISLLEEMAALHGGPKGAILAGLAALKGKTTTKADIIAWIERNA